jgi:thiol-disulfide isomerase/thioredoxin
MIKTHRRRSIASLAAAAGLVLAACGGSDASGDAAATDSASASAADPAAEVATARLTGAATVDGSAFDAATLPGKPTVLWFWAPWCLVCRGEAPEIVDTVDRYGADVHFIGVAGLGDNGEMREFVSDTNTGGFLHLDDTNGEIWTSYGVYAQPAFAFITADGRLVQTVSGPLSADDLMKVIDNLLRV